MKQLLMLLLNYILRIITIKTKTNLFHYCRFTWALMAPTTSSISVSNGF